MKQLPFWLFTAAVFTLLILPALLQDGMFMDGQQYAIVARNLAEGRGTFWHPVLSDSWLRDGGWYFLEHPPLVYALQAPFFEILGESRFTERIYSLLTALFTAFLIVKIWRLAVPKWASTRALGWLPVLFWIIVPTCFWSFQNNMLENTMGIFILLAAYFGGKAVYFQTHFYRNLFLAGLAVFLATLSKGVPGLFPIVLVGIHWLVFRSFPWRKMVFGTLVLMAVPAACYALLMLWPPASDSLTFVFARRLFGRITDEPIVGNHFYILGRLVAELAVPLLLAGLLLLICKRKNTTAPPSFSHKKHTLFFALLGLAGSLPVMLTPVQKTFYITAAFPFFALAIAFWVGPVLQIAMNRLEIQGRTFQIFKAVSAALLVAALIFSFWMKDQPGRDAQKLEDVYALGKIIPEKATVAAEQNVYFDWAFQFYLLRYFHIEMDGADSGRKFYLKKKGGRGEKKGYEKVPLDLNGFELWEQRN